MRSIISDCIIISSIDMINFISSRSGRLPAAFAETVVGAGTGSHVDVLVSQSGAGCAESKMDVLVIIVISISSIITIKGLIVCSVSVL